MSKRGHFEEPGILPEGYAPLEYIESTVTQYIIVNTNMLVGKYAALEADLLNVSYGFYFDDYYAPRNFTRNYYSHTTDATEIGGRATNGGTPTNEGNRFIFTLSTLGITADGVFKNLNRPLTSTVTKIRLFNSRRNGDYYSHTRLFSLHLESDNHIINDFIPALRIFDSKPGLWDITNETFYTNAGTGEFLYN